jgi:hypothetical protein
MHGPRMQQRKLQWYENPLGETPCRFESGPRHDTLPLCRLQGPQAVDCAVKPNTVVSASANAWLDERLSSGPLGTRGSDFFGNDLGHHRAHIGLRAFADFAVAHVLVEDQVVDDVAEL